MDSSETKSKRGKKRQSDEANLTEDERMKKEKNREAARKCRQKKQDQANELKVKNENLEKENRKLADDKDGLEKTVKKYMQIIQTHLHKGCILPQEVQSLWHQEASTDTDRENFRAVATIEAPCSTPPRTPESSGSVTPPSGKTIEMPADTAPVGLFGGTQLNLEMMKFRSSRSSSSSTRSPSISPSPPPQTQTRTGARPDLNHYLNNAESLPDVLAPIQLRSRRQTETRQTQYIIQLTGNPEQTLPTVVSEYEQETLTNNIPMASLIKQDQNMWMSQGGTLSSTSEVLQGAFEQPPVFTHDQISKAIYSNEPVMSVESTNYNSQNLPSSGFMVADPVNAIEGYSYFEDLQQEERPEQIIGQMSTANEQAEQSQSTNNGSHPEVSTNAQNMSHLHITHAQALLSLGTEITPTLQQQIKTSYGSPLSSQAACTVAVTKPGQSINHTAITHSQPQQQRFVQENVQQWIQSSPALSEQHDQHDHRNILIEREHISNKGFINLAQAVSQPPSKGLSGDLSSSNRAPVQVIRLSSSQYKSRKVQERQLQPSASATIKSSTGQQLTQSPSPPASSHGQSQLSPAISNQQFISSSCVTRNSPSQASQNVTNRQTSTQNGEINHSIATPQFLPPTSTFSVAGCAATCEVVKLPSGDIITNLPSLGFGDLDSDSNIFEKQPMKSS